MKRDKRIRPTLEESSGIKPTLTSSRLIRELWNGTGNIYLGRNQDQEHYQCLSFLQFLLQDILEQLVE